MTDKEKLSCLIDRPCTACKFHNEDGCCKWNCVFDQKSELPEGDLISREKLKDYLDRNISFGGVEKKFAFFDIIDSIPSAENKGEWIPVSERLPKIADVYRVTRYYPNNVMNPNYIVDACAFDGSDTWYDDNRINHERAYVNNVIAWQENPEPYKAESEGK